MMPDRAVSGSVVGRPFDVEEAPFLRDFSALGSGAHDLAQRDGGECHVEHDRGSRGSGRGEGHGIVAADPSPRAEGRDVWDAGRGAEGDEALGGGHHRVEGAHAPVVAVAQGSQGETGLFGLGDGALHGAGDDQLADAAVAVDDVGDGGLLEHLEAGGRIVATGLEVSGVPAEALEAVGVDAAEVGGELDLDGELGVV